VFMESVGRTVLGDTTGIRLNKTENM